MARNVRGNPAGKEKGGRKPPVKEAIKKGRPQGLPPGAMRGGPPPDPCRDCVITALNNQAFPPRTTTATAYQPENVQVYTVTATPNPANCPCEWSREVFVEYVAVLTGAAAQIKRKNLKFPQLLELIRIDPRNPNNPYVRINGCSISIRIRDLNRDLRAGINTQNAFFQGVVTALKFGVKCGQQVRTIVINITDP